VAGRTRFSVAGASAAAVVAAAMVIPLTLGAAAGSVNPGAGRAATGTSLGPGPGAEKEAPPWPWTVTVNGHARGALGTPMNQAAGVPLFDATPGEKLTIAVTVTVPAHSTMTKLFLGITGGYAGVGPRGPIGMKPVLATASLLAAGPHRFTLRWTVPRAAAPDGYYLAFAAYWPRGTKNEPQAEEAPMVHLG
jgi:hypothetical protein